MSYEKREDVRPQKGKQSELFNMIANAEADFYLIGGSRFGGKSEIISMVDLLYAHDPKYRSIKFRRSFDEIMGANGLWEKAENQYSLFGANSNKSDKSWTFPSGAKSLYRHMYHEGDEESHRGKGYSSVFFDEINQFTWNQVRMLQTCLRSEAKNDSFLVGTLNPDRSSWCMEFVDWYICQDTGFPDLSKCGKIRHYIIDDGKPVFGPDEQFFIDNYPDIVNPVVDFETGERQYIRPKRFTFFFFSIMDNHIGRKMNPQYISELNGLPEHERLSQLLGNWFSEPKGSSMFQRQSLKGLDSKYPSRLPDDAVCVRAWDKAYREPSEKNRYPDYTASIKMYKDSKGEFYIAGDFHEKLHDSFKVGEDVIYGRFRKNVGIRDEWMVLQAYHDGDDCTVILPEESGAGAGEWDKMRAMFMEEGFLVKGAKTGNAKGAKGKRFVPFCSAAEQGAVHILPDTFPNAATLNKFLTELEKFDPDVKSTGRIKDDWVDATADAFLALQKHRVSKPFTLPNISSPTKLSRYKSSGH
jgi:phage terminase large subunit-like protein